MGTSARVRERDFGDAGRGQTLVEGSVGTKEAAVAVRGVFANADVTCNVGIGEEATKKTDGGDDRPVGVVCGSTTLILHARSI